MTILIRRGTVQDHARLLVVWRSAVEATHRSLTPWEIDAYERQVETYLPQMGEIWVAVDEDEIVGFLAHDGGGIEMLFVDADRRARGVGRALVDQIAARFPRLRVDVNEENPGARGFYAALGFSEIGRSELDGEGKPHPILHLERLSG